jgi:hypothetical protein
VRLTGTVLGVSSLVAELLAAAPVLPCEGLN